MVSSQVAKLTCKHSLLRQLTEMEGRSKVEILLILVYRSTHLVKRESNPGQIKHLSLPIRLKMVTSLFKELIHMQLLRLVVVLRYLTKPEVMRDRSKMVSHRIPLRKIKQIRSRLKH
jgi:hypothetical protein